MKKILVFLFVLLASTAQAAIPAGAVWEVRTTGADTDGGGFVVGVTSKTTGTDLAVSAGSNLQVSSSGYGFTSADVGRYIKITSGTGWTVGYYQVLSVTTGVATLDHSPAAVSTGSGSFTVYYGIDYSQQNSANSSGSNISVTNAVAAGTTTITSATASFTADIVGNIVYLAGGSGSLAAGWYEVTAYTNATTIIVDRTVAAGTGITLNVGGALADLATAALAEVSYNIVWVKNTATYVVTAGVTFANKVYLYGYNTTRGDSGRATIQGSTTAGMTLLTFSNNFLLNNFIVDCNNLSSSYGITATSAGITNNVTIKNYYTTGVNAPTVNTTYILNNTEVTGSTNSASNAIYTSGILQLINSTIHDTSGNGLNGSYPEAFVQNNLFYNITGTALNTGNDCAPFIVSNNTFYNAGTAVQLNLQNCPIGQLGIVAKNNIFSSMTGWAITNGSNGIVPGPNLDGNAYYANSSGNIQLYGAGTTGSVTQPYVNTLDVLLTGSPFVNASSGNFSLNTIAGAGGAVRGTGVPSSWIALGSTTSYPSFGPVQPNTTTIAGGSFSFGQ